MPRRVVTAALAAGILGTLVAAAPALAQESTVVTAPNGTPIQTYFFPAAGLKPGQKAPTVLEGPGFGGTAQTNPNSPTDTYLGVIGVGPLRQAGYNVVTWDPPGFGASGGTAEFDSVDTEAPAVSAVIDWLAQQPGVQLDKPGDPRVGMAGGSYGGGIQFATAETDKRVDVITPDIAWNSLTTSLYKAETIKSSWAQLLALVAVVRGQRNDPVVAQALAESQQGFTLSQPLVAFFQSRGPGRMIRRIRIPTLLLQGTVDTLFTLNESVVNYGLLAENGVPRKMVWFCGGHGACLTNRGDTGRIQRSVLAWFGRYLKGDTKQSTGPGFEWLDQRGKSFAARSFPPAPDKPVLGSGSGDLTLSADGGSGPYTGSLTGPFAEIASIIGSVVGTEASNAVNVRVKAKSTAQVLGAPVLDITYQGTADRPDSRLLAQVVDDSTGKVLGNQVTPIDVVLDGASHTVKVPLEIVSAYLAKGKSLTVQIVAQSSIYNAFPVPGSVRLSKVDVNLPTVKVKR